MQAFCLYDGMGVPDSLRKVLADFGADVVRLERPGSGAPVGGMTRGKRRYFDLFIYSHMADYTCCVIVWPSI